MPTHDAINNKQDGNIIFVSGPSRSGTTLLQLVLSAHPEINITPETFFIKKTLNLGKKYSRGYQLSDNDKNKIIEYISEDTFLSTWPHQAKNRIIEFINDNYDVTIKDILFFLFNKTSTNSRNKKYIGNKQEIYIDGLGLEAKKLFPQSKFIIIIRDPRDVTFSIIKNFSTDRKRGLFKSAATVYSANKYIDELISNYERDVLVIKYEDLVTKPEETCRIMCKYLNIMYNSSMIKFYENNKSGRLLIGETKNIHENTRSPFNTALIEQWKNNSFFTRNRIMVIESINTLFMKKYNYIPTANRTFIVGYALSIAAYLRYKYKHIKYKHK